jgi:hypothetical protein
MTDTPRDFAPDAPRDFGPCDQDRNGTESAAVVIYTRSGQIQLCAHHFERSKATFPPDYIAVPMQPDHAVLRELAVPDQQSSRTRMRTRPAGEVTYTMRDHW